MTLIRQRTDGDCAICSLAMFLGKSYEDLLPLYTPEEVMDGALSTRTMEIACSFGRCIDVNYDEQIDYRCPAILCVDSLNNEAPKATHMVYWDGHEILDPSTKNTFGPHDKPRVRYALQETPSEPFTAVYDKDMGFGRPSMTDMMRLFRVPTETVVDMVARAGIADRVRFLFKGHPPLQGE